MIENLVTKIIKKIRQIVLPAAKVLNMEDVFKKVDVFVTKLLKPFGINLEENPSRIKRIEKFLSGFGDLF